VRFVLLLSWLVPFVSLAAAPVQPDQRTRIIVMPLGASDARLGMLAASVTEQVMTELGESGLADVVGHSDLAAVLGLERQRQLMGCEGSTNCLAEMSAAMGAPFIVTGSLARLGKSLRVDLKVIRASDGKALFRSGKSIKDESEVFEVVSQLVKALVPVMALPEVKPVTRPAQVVTPAPTGPSPESTAPTVVSQSPQAPVAGPRLAPWLVLGLGVAAGIGSAVLLITAEGLKGTLDSRSVAFAKVPGVVNDANTRYLVGEVLAGVGGAAVLGGLLWLLLGQPATPTALSVTPTGLGLALGGAW
jgi:TolB-like protein